MLVFQIVGPRHSGKTTTVEQLVRYFKASGYKTGTVKSINCPLFTLDTKKGSNTKRHLDAGADIVVAHGPRETDYIYPIRHDIDTILGNIEHEGIDVCIVEGGYAYDLPRIVCAREYDDLPSRITSNTFALSGVITNDPSFTHTLPCVNAVSDISSLGALILEKVTEYKPGTELLPVPGDITKFCLNCHSRQPICPEQPDLRP